MSSNSSPQRRGGATSFQLYQQKNNFCSFFTYDLLARNAGGSKKKDVLPMFVSVNVLFFHGVWTC
jgi:hypothetical protein